MIRIRHTPNQFAVVAAAVLATAFGLAGFSAVAQPEPVLTFNAGGEDPEIFLDQVLADPINEVFVVAASFDPAPADPVVVRDLPLVFQPAELEPMKLAHAGQLSPKDDCHNHRAENERHWHVKGTSDRGGPCVKQNGETFRLTNHAICADERILLVRENKEWLPDYESVAEALKNCVLRLPSPPD